MTHSDAINIFVTHASIYKYNALLRRTLAVGISWTVSMGKNVASNRIIRVGQRSLKVQHERSTMPTYITTEETSSNDWKAAACIMSDEYTPSWTPAAVRVFTVSGRAEILALSSDLEAFAGRVGQSGAMHGLEQLINGPYSSRKTPHLVCVSSNHSRFPDFSLEHLLGFALFFEYTVGLMHTGLFATGDDSGVRTVIALPGQRAFIAARACLEMLTGGATLILASFKLESIFAGTSSQRNTLSHAANVAWAVRTRNVRDQLALKSSYESTLATLGKRTRIHLRSYRRKLMTECDCRYVPDATLYLKPGDLQTLNLNSLDRLPQSICDFRYRTTVNSNGGFVSGLQAGDGRWLGLIGGWHHGGATVIQWQMNSASYEKLSVGTVLRSFCIEHEVERGATTLMFHGGTSHSMNHSFTEEQVADLIVKRSGLLGNLIVWAIPVMFRSVGLFKNRGNFLADVLKNSHLHWVSSSLASMCESSAAYVSAHQAQRPTYNKPAET